jgi:hypothetical protein
MKDPDLDLKIIHLIRDPRAVARSRKSIHTAMTDAEIGSSEKVFEEFHFKIKSSTKKMYAGAKLFPQKFNENTPDTIMECLVLITSNSPKSTILRIIFWPS